MIFLIDCLSSRFSLQQGIDVFWLAFRFDLICQHFVLMGKGAIQGRFACVLVWADCPYGEEWYLSDRFYVLVYFAWFVWAILLMARYAIWQVSLICRNKKRTFCYGYVWFGYVLFGFALLQWGVWFLFWEHGEECDMSGGFHSYLHWFVRAVLMVRYAIWVVNLICRNRRRAIYPVYAWLGFVCLSSVTLILVWVDLCMLYCCCASRWACWVIEFLS